MHQLHEDIMLLQVDVTHVTDPSECSATQLGYTSVGWVWHTRASRSYASSGMYMAA